MRIAIGVHGRFSAFNLAIGLLELGEDVRLFTNYPRNIASRFGVPRASTRSLVVQGVAARALNRVFGGDGPRIVEAGLKRGFGTWLSHEIARANCDVAFCWSGVAEETFRETKSLKVLNRSSLHIVAQHRLLADESRRVGAPVQLPSPWIIERERREYALADLIVVPSRTARRSFEEYGGAAKVVVVPLTASAEKWRPVQEVIDERLRRITSGKRLRVLYVGAVTYQKGLHDMCGAVEALRDVIDFRFTGVITEEARPVVDRLAGAAQFDGHVPEAELPSVYAWADVLMCPSIQDGFGVVLAHAQGAAVPFIASENTGGPDLLEMGGRGWVVPIRSAPLIIERLEWCNDHRDELATMVTDLYEHPLNRTWADVGRDFLSHCKREVG